MHGLDPANKAPTVQEYLDHVHPQDRESMAELIKRILSEPARFDTTKRIVRPDGEVRYVRCVGAPVAEKERLKKFVGTAIDVTEYELLTQELHRREAYLTEAQRLSHTGSFGWRPDTGEIVWSDETYRIFEYDGTLKPTVDSVVQRVHPDDRDLVQRVIDRGALTSRASQSQSLEAPHPEDQHGQIQPRASQPQGRHSTSRMIPKGPRVRLLPRGRGRTEGWHGRWSDREVHSQIVPCGRRCQGWKRPRG